MARVEYVILADSATVADGKLYIHGGGWGAIAAHQFPVAHKSFGVAFATRVGWNETNQPLDLSLDVVDQDAKSILPSGAALSCGTLRVGRPPQIVAGTDQTVPGVVTLEGLTFPAGGTYAVVLSINGAEAARSTFQVIAA